MQLNLEKTTVIPIAAAANNNFRMNALNLGFGLDNEFTVLGFKIDNKLTRLRENIVKIKQKMIAQADFWKKFKMTIFGRLNMAKTFLIRQISYIAPVLSLSKKDYSDRLKEGMQIVRQEKDPLSHHHHHQSRTDNGLDTSA